VVKTVIATFVACFAIASFLIRTIIKYRNKKDTNIVQKTERKSWQYYILSLAAGLVATNGFFHFYHGILGIGDFPAPFSKLLGKGISTIVSNVIWGTFNFIVSFLLIISCRKGQSKKLMILFFIIGVITMSIFLR
jgi:hypothetical protein